MKEGKKGICSTCIYDTKCMYQKGAPVHRCGEYEAEALPEDSFSFDEMGIEEGQRRWEEANFNKG